jgi:hypothetical protein
VFSSNTARPLSCLLLFPNRSLLPLVAIVRFVRDYQDHARSVIVMCIRATTFFFLVLALFHIVFFGRFSSVEFQCGFIKTYTKVHVATSHTNCVQLDIVAGSQYFSDEPIKVDYMCFTPRAYLL